MNNNENKLICIDPFEAIAPSVNVSSKYAFISTRQFIDDMASLGWNLSSTKSRSRTGLGKHAMRFRHENYKCPSGDFVEIVALNAHDGSSSFVLQFGIFRLVCSNGLVIGKVLVEPVRIRHVGYTADKVSSAVNTLLSQLEKVHTAIAKLQTTTLTEEQYENFKLAATMIRGLNPATTAIEQFNTARREADKGYTAWAVLNRIQESLVNGFGYVNEKNEIRRARAIKGVKSQLDLNTQLFDAVLQIAA